MEDASLETHAAESYLASEHLQEETATVPEDLPTQTYVEEFEVQDEPALGLESLALNDLENQAHAQKVLLSSDAMRYFIANVRESDRTAELDRVLQKAHASFPSEDGWVVINLARMEEILEKAPEAAVTSDDSVSQDATAPMTAGSLAEAILGGNTITAYQMISHRPMVALADAAADLDAVYRFRKGEEKAVSDVLKTRSEKLSDEQLQAAIVALTSALDGTYTDEESAVKMAILKAINAIA